MFLKLIVKPGRRTNRLIYLLALTLVGAASPAIDQAIVLTSESPLDENSLAAPTKVSPKTEAFNFSSTTIHRDLPGNSLTVLRIGTTTD